MGQDILSHDNVSTPVKYKVKQMGHIKDAFNKPMHEKNNDI